MSAHDVLLIGMSSLAHRRVLPALLGLDRIGRIHVASKTATDIAYIPAERRGSLWNDYDVALHECAPCIAYVSLPNALHATWVRRALEHRFHVIVDKPAFVAEPGELDSAIELAQASSLVLAEATVWTQHPIAVRLSELARTASSTVPLAAIASFTSPPMPSSNFRYSARLGGGCIRDRGPYAVSCGRLLFGCEPPSDVDCMVLSHTGGTDSVDLSFSVTLRYPRGMLMGYFSLESEYQNKLELIGGDVSCAVDRVFTPPADFEGTLSIRRHNVSVEESVPPADSFATFVDDVVNAIDGADFATHATIMNHDAQLLQRIRDAAKGAIA